MGHRRPSTLHPTLQKPQHIQRKNLQALRAYVLTCPASSHCPPKFHSPSTPTSTLTPPPVYPDLKDFAPELKVFYNKQHYAGSWSGIDLHGTARDLMRMDLSSLPYKVRDWLKRNPSQKHFSVQEDSVFFAPGAIYPILPLWVDEPEEGELECETAFDELDRYSAELGDGRVVGRVVQRESGKNEVEFTVEAVLVKKKGRAPTRGREEL
jgi:hypothetical protein